jgi:hypothetical protein
LLGRSRDSPRTIVPGGEAEIEFPLLISFATVHDRQVAATGQFSQQRCEFESFTAGLVELAYSPILIDERI